MYLIGSLVRCSILVAFVVVVVIVVRVAEYMLYVAFQIICCSSDADDIVFPFFVGMDNNCVVWSISVAMMVMILLPLTLT